MISGVSGCTATCTGAAGHAGPHTFPSALPSVLEVQGAPTPAQNAIYDHVVACFDACQGLTEFSTEESDRYYELAEALMQILGKSIGSPLLRIAATEAL